MDFPLKQHPNGQWYKQHKKKRYYFGAIKDDPKGVRAVQELAERWPGILAGTDHLRHTAASTGKLTVGELAKLFLAQRWIDAGAGSISKLSYNNYAVELKAFVEWVQPGTAVEALKPEHFAAYVTLLIQTRKQMAWSRKRTQSLIKAMFRWGSGNGHSPLPNFGTSFKSPSTTPEAIRREKLRAGLHDASERIVTGEEIDKLLAACKGKPNMRAIILLGVNCGLGPADIGRLRWNNIQANRLVYPRPKTGNLRICYLWKKTLDALVDVKRLKHTRDAMAASHGEALVFITRKRQPYYREREIIKDGNIVGVQVANPISLNFGRMASKLNMKGVTFYRLRHTFKTLGKSAKDRDALNLMMGHKANNIEELYDHEQISFKRIRRVALKVKAKLWPKEKSPSQTGTLKLADAAPDEKGQAA